ncbi:glycosyltransferase family 4 protein [Candidatus Peregrinibacteria bacterium]|nr:glycosyltransferase family 4 protein [Candidatus Peregrinibacteria bacterium]
MHLTIDIREACRQKRAGKGQWTFHFVSELLERDIGLTLLTDAPLPSVWDTKMNPTHGPQRTCVLLTQRGIAWHWAAARYTRSETGSDVYVSPTSYIVPRLLGKRVPFVPIVHDLIAFRDEPHDRKARLIEQITLKKTAEAAHHICTVSRATTSDLLARFPALPRSKVSAIFAGPVFEINGKNQPDGKTILSIGTLSPRKNQLRLIQAFAKLPEHLRSRHRLILIGGRGWDDAPIIEAANHTENTEWKSYLPDEDCTKILMHATVLAFPSLYEGFGMPVLDALRAGLPVLTSDRGSMREVAGDAAHFVDPEDVSSIASGLERLLTDDTLRKNLAARGLERADVFSWPKTVDLFLEAIGTIKS